MDAKCDKKRADWPNQDRYRRFASVHDRRNPSEVAWLLHCYSESLKKQGADPKLVAAVQGLLRRIITNPRAWLPPMKPVE